MTNRIRIGLESLPQVNLSVEGRIVEFKDGRYYCISDYDGLEPFLISLLSDCDLWMYVSSKGGLTAGRRSADFAIFPYQTVDKLHSCHRDTGPCTVIRCAEGDQLFIWQPFSDDGHERYEIKRCLYKNLLGCDLWFEEINHSLGLVFRYCWRPGRRFGWLRIVEIANLTSKERNLETLDGLLNLLPPGVTKPLQESLSCLADAYKYGECDPETGLAILSLTSNIVDRPEPSEALYATVAWQSGLKDVEISLDGTVISQFVRSGSLPARLALKGKRLSYLLSKTVKLAAKGSTGWVIGVDTLCDHAKVISLKASLSRGISGEIEEDFASSRQRLARLIACADGFQLSADDVTTGHHISNVAYNIARGGVPPNGYRIDKDDLLDFLYVRNRAIWQRYRKWVEKLPRGVDLPELHKQARGEGDPDLIRLCYEYLPITFSRRHGDPSRPWNQFSIDVQKADGSFLYSYQGNWRDIFQNWEALCRSFPLLLEPIIAKFVNASTVDGFNPYRIARDGIDWEVPDPGNPWSSVGYWGDHQIVYLLRLMELLEAHYPERLTGLVSERFFSYADVPYRLKSYAEIVKDPRHTIEFDWEQHRKILARTDREGTDGRLLHKDGHVHNVSLAEKLLVPILAKICCLVPGGGIWMNTVRPEWNDANNALAGHGLSIVTTCYLVRHLEFCRHIYEEGAERLPISQEVVTWLRQVTAALDDFSDVEWSDRSRRQFTDAAGEAFSRYRSSVYSRGLGETTFAQRKEIVEFLKKAQALALRTVQKNRRDDGLFHAYNVLHLEEGSARITHLPLMLEGQVAAISSGVLSHGEVIEVLKALRKSPLYREDQRSYLLYPVKKLPGFLERNNVPEDVLQRCPELSRLVAQGDRSIVVRDEEGKLHFNADLDNARALRARIGDRLPDREIETLLEVYEDVFRHKEFTGRSGAMYAYEGIGCIYWHMVGKLLLAVAEAYNRAVREGADVDLLKEIRDCYNEIRSGMGFTKTPAEFGALPLDPYSHTPAEGGAKQPGLSGQVKEEILARWLELGVCVEDGKVHFRPGLLRKEEFLTSESEFTYIDVNGKKQSLRIPSRSLAFTFCQVPVVYRLSDETHIEVTMHDGKILRMEATHLDSETTQEIVTRSMKVASVTFTLPMISNEDSM